MILTTIFYRMQEDQVRSRGSVRTLVDAWERCPLDVSMLIMLVHFSPFLDSLVNTPKKQHVILILASFQHQWDNTNTFHLKFREITMTPLNFHMLMELPFKGGPIYIDQRRVVTAEGMEATLGIRFLMSRGNAIRLEALTLYIKPWHKLTFCPLWRFASEPDVFRCICWGRFLLAMAMA